MLAFFGVAPGMRVAELGAGGGYTTELLARTVGPNGTVYGQNNKFILERFAAFPGAGRAGFAPRVRELDARDGAVRRNCVHDARQNVDVRIIPDTEILGGDAAARRDGRGLRHHQRGTAHGTAGEMHQMPVAGKAIGGAVLAHR